MLFLVALLVPPLAVLLCGKPFQFLINLGLCVVAIPLGFVAGIGVGIWIVAIIHAILVVNATAADKRNRQLIRAVEKSRS